MQFKIYVTFMVIEISMNNISLYFLTLFFPHCYTINISGLWYVKILLFHTNNCTSCVQFFFIEIRETILFLWWFKMICYLVEGLSLEVKQWTKVELRSEDTDNI